MRKESEVATVMPVIRTSKEAMHAGHRPEWSDVTSAGIFRVPREGGRFDCHYHDCHEYWLIFRGKAKVRSEGQEHYVQRGDIVCTRAGDEHDVLEVYEDLEAFWFEGETPPGGRIGHLHRDEEKAKGHPVPALPVPSDFSNPAEA
jgi:mannose-6-phosphate isomerase-like protein (cupin superfamily)